MNPLFKKNRLFNLLIFDADYYKNHYEDLKETDYSAKELHAHFTKIGIPEGRSASIIFDVKYYMELNTDIKNSVGNNYQKAIKHFLTYGVHEGRPTSPHFNVNFYVSNNEDIRNKFGYNYLKLYKHFTLHGKDEKRIYNPNVIPDSYMIELTNACNLNCITCPREYKFGKKMSIGSMNFNNLQNLLKEILPLARSINLTGLGETFLYKQLPEVIDIISDYNSNITTFLSTNAQTPNCLSIFENIKGKISLVQISTDGVGTMYEKIRPGANFSTFSKNVKKMSQAAEGTSTSLMLNMVAFHENYITIPDVVKFAKDIGIKHVHINTRNIVTMPQINLSDYNFYKKEAFLKALTKGETIARKSGIGFSKYSNNGYCDLVYNHFYITWDGFLVPCCAKPFPKELQFGNVFEETLLSCIKNYQTSVFREKWDRKSIPEFCQRCHVVH